MYDVANTNDCSDSPSWDDPEAQGCGTGAAYVFFFSFTLLVTFVMLNVFIAVILEGFGDISAEEDMAVLSKPQMEQFVSRWCALTLTLTRATSVLTYVGCLLCRMEFDPKATMFIKMAQLRELFTVLPLPMGFGFDYFATDNDLWEKIRTYCVHAGRKRWLMSSTAFRQTENSNVPWRSRSFLRRCHRLRAEGDFRE